MQVFKVTFNVLLSNIFNYIFFSKIFKPLLNIFDKDNSEFYLKFTNKLELYFTYFIIFTFEISSIFNTR